MVRRTQRNRRLLPMICSSVFDHVVGLAHEGSKLIHDYEGVFIDILNNKSVKAKAIIRFCPYNSLYTVKNRPSLKHFMI